MVPSVSVRVRARSRSSAAALRMSFGRILLQQPEHKAFERRREIASMRRRQLGLIVKNRVRNRDLLIPTKWLSSGEHLVEHDTERPQVRTSVHVLAPDLLRRHIGHRPEADAGFAQTLIPRFGQSKVEDPHRAVGQQHDVARLQVAVHDSGGVCGLQPFSDLSRDLQSLAHGNGTVAGQSRSERFARYSAMARKSQPSSLVPTSWTVQRLGWSSAAAA